MHHMRATSPSWPPSPPSRRCRHPDLCPVSGSEPVLTDKWSGRTVGDRGHVRDVREILTHLEQPGCTRPAEKSLWVNQTLCDVFSARTDAKEQPTRLDLTTRVVVLVRTDRTPKGSMSGSGPDWILQYIPVASFPHIQRRGVRMRERPSERLKSHPISTWQATEWRSRRSEGRIR